MLKMQNPLIYDSTARLWQPGLDHSDADRKGTKYEPHTRWNHKIHYNV